VRAVVFAYHNVGDRCLRVLHARGVDVALVVTHRDRPDENIWFRRVADTAAELNLSFIYGEDPTDPALAEAVRAAKPDVIFSFYYRSMIPADLLAVAPQGAFNMHGSLLPKYRGRVPVNWAVLRGETETGATLHAMEAKPDAGYIVDQTSVPILPDDTAGEVFEKVTVAAEQTLWRAARHDGRADAQAAQRALRGQLFLGTQARGRPHRFQPTGSSGLQPDPRRGAALPGRVHRHWRPPLHRRAGTPHRTVERACGPEAWPACRGWTYRGGRRRRRSHPRDAVARRSNADNASPVSVQVFQNIITAKS
jgi:methionyl-tRNA formyltransferase